MSGEVGEEKKKVHYGLVNTINRIDAVRNAHTTPLESVYDISPYGLTSFAENQVGDPQDAKGNQSKPREAGNITMSERFICTCIGC